MRQPKDWGQPCSPPHCTHYRLMSRGNMSAISTSLTQSGKRRIFLCSACDTMFSDTRDTVFFDLRTSEEQGMMALKMLLVKVGLSDIGFVLGVTEETILMWLERAAHKADEVNAPLLRDLPVTEVQRDEMWSLHQAQTRAAGRGGGGKQRPERGRAAVGVEQFCAGVLTHPGRVCWPTDV
jgi:transposase-like protein